MDIHTLKKLETKAIKSSSSDFFKIGIVLLFMVVVLWISIGTGEEQTHSFFLTIAAVFGAYMALNIGANDVANNVGPAVGSKAMTLGVAILIAAVFEASGALIAGGDVVSTIKKGIIDPALFVNPQEFIWAMTAALLAGGLWLNIATYFGAPVSTTHAIVGGVMGGGIAAAGFSIVSWSTMGKIAASWVISPVLGAIIAAIFLYTIKKSIMYKDDRVGAMQKMVPIYVALMAWAFTTYLTLKGLKKVWPSIGSTLNDLLGLSLEFSKKPSFLTAAILGVIVALSVYIFVKPRVKKASLNLEDTPKGVNVLFTIPLIFAAALLSFAHGANDVANAIGPLAAIADVIEHGAISSKAPIPLWVMFIGAIGIALGLALYGPKLIKTVGSEITELNQVRAFSVAMAAAITVIIASQLGLPVSSTHIAIGGIFGVGFLREYLSTSSAQEKIQAEEDRIEAEKQLRKQHLNELESLQSKSPKREEDNRRIQELKTLITSEKLVIKAEKKHLKRAKKAKYVKRDAIKKIVAAWVITVPAAAFISAVIFYSIKTLVS